MNYLPTYFQNPIPNLNEMAQQTQRNATFKLVSYYHYFKYLILAYLFITLIVAITISIIFIKGKIRFFISFGIINQFIIRQ